MKLKKLIVAFLIFIFCMTACAGLQTTSPPTPVVKWSFDVSKRDSKVNQEFRIVEYRSYHFALRFDYSDITNRKRVFALVGDGTREDPGIDIPIHLKISKLDTGSLPPELIYENTILTKHYYGQAYGYFEREIIAINLKPGMYRVEANAMEDRPEFLGTQTYLQIEPHSQIKFLPGSIK